MIRVPVLGLLKSVSNATNVNEVLETVNANFTAEMRPVHFKDSEGNFKLYPKSSVIIRTDTQQGLSVCSNNYGIVQYSEALAFLNAVVSTKEAAFYSAAVTDNGARLHVVLKANDYIEISDGEKVDFFFYVVASHDQTASVCTMVTPVHNLSQTIFTPLDNGVVKFKHSKYVHNRMNKLKNIYVTMNNEWKSCTEQFKTFATIKLNGDQINSFFRSICPGDSKQAEHTREKLVDIYHTGPLSSLASCKESLWGAFMAVQQYADFYKTTKKSSKRTDTESRIEGRLIGSAARQKAFAYSVSVKMASMSMLRK